MSDQQAQPQAPAETGSATVTTHAPAPSQPMVRQVDPAEEQARTAAILQLLTAVRSNADAASMAQAAQDANDFSRAALQLAQAAVILDPNLVGPQGVPASALHPPVPHIQMQHSGAAGGQGA